MSAGQQASLFDAPAPEVEHHRHAFDPHVFVQAVPRDTQETAAAALPRSGTQRRRVLDTIAGAGEAGMTDQDIAVALGLAENSVRPRRLELADNGLIKASGQRRETSTGSQRSFGLRSHVNP